MKEQVEETEYLDTIITANRTIDREVNNSVQKNLLPQIKNSREEGSQQ
jgi:hypothetical protein